MGKVKSAIITALLVAAIVVLALFATISVPELPGSNGIDRYNSFITNINLGADLSGEASATLYPAGVISESDYRRAVYGNADKQQEYEEKYVRKNGFYIDKEKLGEDDGAAFAASVKADAEVLSDRFSEKEYSSYSVSVVNGYAIKITVPTGFTYAEYREYMTAGNSSKISDISHAVTYLMADGGLKLWSSQTYEDGKSLYFEKEENAFNGFFKGARAFKAGDVNALEIELTAAGVSVFNDAVSESDGYLYIGKTPMGLSFTSGQSVSDKLTFQVNGSFGVAKDYAIAIDSVAKGKMLVNAYNDSDESTSPVILTKTPAYGKYAAIYFGSFALAVILAAAFLPVIKYKKLGLVNAIMVAAYAVSLVTAIFLTGVELTVAGLFTALLPLAVMCFSNFFTFEGVRRETEVGRVYATAVKTGYKRTLFGILDLHVILILASVIMTLVGVGELAACGLIFLIGSIASYVLYWLTRFMWYVLSSNVSDKNAFCGFKREAEDDE